MVRDVKERFCIVASDSGSISNTSAKLYMMPDGKQAETIVYEWAKAAETLFNPAIAGNSQVFTYTHVVTTSVGSRILGSIHNECQH